MISAQPAKPTGGGSSPLTPQTFADAAARSAAVPAVVGQLGVQADTSQLYRANSTTAGDWSLTTGGLSANTIPDFGGNSIGDLYFFDGSALAKLSTTGPTVGKRPLVMNGPGTTPEWSQIPMLTYDTGWTANYSAGDKTVSVLDYTGGGSLAGFDATADAQIISLTKKLQAIQSALASLFLPNT